MFKSMLMTTLFASMVCASAEPARAGWFSRKPKAPGGISGAALHLKFREFDVQFWREADNLKGAVRNTPEMLQVLKRVQSLTKRRVFDSEAKREARAKEAKELLDYYQQLRGRAYGDPGWFQRMLAEEAAFGKKVVQHLSKNIEERHKKGWYSSPMVNGKSMYQVAESQAASEDPGSSASGYRTYRDANGTEYLAGYAPE